MVYKGLFMAKLPGDLQAKGLFYTKTARDFYKFCQGDFLVKCWLKVMFMKKLTDEYIFCQFLPDDVIFIKSFNHKRETFIRIAPKTPQ